MNTGNEVAGTTELTGVKASSVNRVVTTLEIMDNSTVIGTATTDEGGLWQYTVRALSIGKHVFSARVVGGGPTSQPRAISVTTPLPPLIIDTSPVVLAGRLLRTPENKPTHFPQGTVLQRSASGGVPPYTYTSSSAVVDLDPQTGRISSKRNGQAIISVRDSQGQSASYTVTVSNVLLMHSYGGYRLWKDAVAFATSRNGHVPSLAEWQEFRSNYSNSPPVSNNDSWSSDVVLVTKRWVIHPVDGSKDKKDSGFLGPNTSCGWAVAPG